MGLRWRCADESVAFDLHQGLALHEHAAALVETAKHLIANGANPNHIDSLGHTPLYGVESMALLDVLLLEELITCRTSHNFFCGAA